MFLHVSKVTYLEDYRLQIHFNDDTIHVIDLANELEGEIFEPLQTKTYFQQVSINEETGTIEWPNGADFAPEFLQEIGQPIELAIS